MSKYRVVKVFNGYPCAHRQWRHDGHCSLIHGYQRRFVCVFEAEACDERGWVIDFGGFTMKSIRAMLDDNFDHTLLIAVDDPEAHVFEAHDGGLWKLVVLPYGPGMEGTARHVLEWINDFISFEHELQARKVRCVRVECWENEKNAGIWEVTHG